jgi:hypothetical protein
MGFLISVDWFRHKLLPDTKFLPRRQVCAAFAFFREAAHVAGVHFKKSMWCLRYETGEMTGRDHYHCLLSVGSPAHQPPLIPSSSSLGSEWVGIATCFYLMDFWEKKLRCGHARRGGGREQWRLAGGRAVRVFAPAEEEEGNSGGWWAGEPLGGAAYTCKDRVEGNSGGWQVAGSPFTGKDRTSRLRTVLTLSDSSLREVCGAVETIRFPLHRHAATDSRLRRRHPRHPWTRTSPGLWKIKGPDGPPRQRGAAGLLEDDLYPDCSEPRLEDGWIVVVID